MRAGGRDCEPDPASGTMMPHSRELASHGEKKNGGKMAAREKVVPGVSVPLVVSIRLRIVLDCGGEEKSCATLFLVLFVPRRSASIWAGPEPCVRPLFFFFFFFFIYFFFFFFYFCFLFIIFFIF
ncbi:unnamed protein product [Pleuronectes platessa]|uniref:Uncharacterized protein n=1 Tax=Pleuronectes platessa TaxID=8262 RepID=A0A9N7TKK0_PLEPL|nr:unnamed protein product [Pleuronectes platessa]